jgi:hypothetical protein
VREWKCEEGRRGDETGGELSPPPDAGVVRRRRGEGKRGEEKRRGAERRGEPSPPTSAVCVRRREKRREEGKRGEG